MRRLSLIAILLAVPAFAQPTESIGKIVSPFIDEHTLVVVRADVTGVDLGSILKLASMVMGEDAGELANAVKAWVKDFAASGGKTVLLTYGAGDYPHFPCLIVPATESNRKPLGEKLVAAFDALGKEGEAITLHGCVCVGTKDALAVLKARKAVERPELLAALDVGRDGVAQVAFAMSAEAKKIHEQVSPTLPAELGGGRIQKITRGLKWVSLSIGTGSKMPAKLMTEAASPQAAHDLKGFDLLALQTLISQLLRIEGESDAGFDKRMKALLNVRDTAIEGSRLATQWDLATTLLEALKVPESAPAERVRSANNLKQLMLALHNYHDVHGRFPTDSRDKDGKPLLSWRVLILPYIEQDSLYKEFRLNEAWDSGHNKKLVAQMPKTLRSPRQAAALKDRTTYLAPLGKGFIWDDPKGLKITEIADGTSNTIALVEADDERAVIWSKPEDISIDVKNPFAGLLGHYVEGVQIAFADGSVRFIRKSIDPKMLWAMFTRDGGEVIKE